MSLGFDFVPGTDIWIDEPALEQEIIRQANGVPQLNTDTHSFTKTDEIIHGRCHNDPHLVVFAKDSIHDEFGLVYFVLSIKGMDLTKPFARYKPIGDLVIRVNGALEAETFYRCRKASELMRREGILTEYVFFQARPKQFPNGKTITGKTNLQGFRNRLHEEYLRSQEEHDDFDPPEVIDAVIRSIFESKFGVAYRGMLSNVRLGEIQYLQDKKQLGEHVSKAILALQMRKPVHFECWPEIQKLNPFREEDHQYYLDEILPRLIGENLAKFHNAGFYHKYLHRNNVTICGEIVDTDSIRHVEIADSDGLEINFATRYADFHEILQEYTKLIALLNKTELRDERPGKLVDAYLRHRDKNRNFEAIEKIIEEVHLRHQEHIPMDVKPSVITVPQATINACRKQIYDALVTNANQSHFHKIENLLDNLTIEIGTNASFNKRVTSNEFTAKFQLYFMHKRVLEIESRRYAFMLVQQGMRKYSSKIPSEADTSGAA